VKIDLGGGEKSMESFHWNEHMIDETKEDQLLAHCARVDEMQINKARGMLRSSAEAGHYGAAKS
jgi:hypothetical protein